MTDLQRYWDRILNGKNEIEKGEIAVALSEKKLNESIKILETDKNVIIHKKSSIKQNEIDLAETDEKIVKLEARRNIVKSEKELKAIDNETTTMKAERGRIEEVLIAAMDELELKEKNVAALSSETAELKAKLAADREAFKQNKEKYEGIISDYQSRFDALSPSLNAAYRQKFLKLLSAKGGKGIAEVRGEICGFCNFNIPASLASESARSDKVSICTNCSRYIYKD